jgi:hypothetical protein
MRPMYLITTLFAAAVASFGSVKAQTVVIEDHLAVAPVVAAPSPIVVPLAPVVRPGMVVVHRAPVVAAPVMVAL